MPITVCKFSKIFRGSMPPDPPRVIFVTLFALNLTLPEKIRLKKSQNLVLKSSEYTLFTWTHFQKSAYLRSLSGLTSLHSVDIQPNSKLHPHHQIFLDPPLMARIEFSKFLQSFENFYFKIYISWATTFEFLR